MPVVIDTDRVTVFHGDALEALRLIPDASLDAVVTDPPYGLSKEPDVAEVLTHWLAGDDYTHTGSGFMGKSWDSFVPGPALWREVFRVLKPGGHALVFAGTRTQDLMGMSLRLAGFEIRDSLAWLYGSGFPKSLDVSKAITATQTLGGSSRVQNRRAMTGDESRSTSFGSGEQTATTTATSAPPPVANLTPDGETWQGWGTALKPAHEPILMARKPLVGTVAANVLAHGTGALNIDGTRVGVSEGDDQRRARQMGNTREVYGDYQGGMSTPAAGRWPANVVLDESQAAALDEQSGPLHTQNPETRKSRSKVTGATGFGTGRSVEYADDKGSGASRFFYVAKAPKKERPVIEHPDGTRTAHPTVKPVALMRWLVRLVTPPGGTVLDPFAGSGTTLEAALLEGFTAVGVELTDEYLPLIQQRVDRVTEAS